MSVYIGMYVLAEVVEFNGPNRRVWIIGASWGGKEWYVTGGRG